MLRGRRGKRTDDLQPEPLTRESSDGRAIMFIHGFTSGPHTWNPLVGHLLTDLRFTGVGLLPFEYSTALYEFRVGRAIPTLDAVAELLKTQFDDVAREHKRVTIVTHSMGGLVAQRMLEQVLSNGRGNELSKLAHLVLIACPNTGSEFFLAVRKALMRNHPQEKPLRPGDEKVQETHKFFLDHVANASATNDGNLHIPLRVFTAEQDGIVARDSGRGYVNSKQCGTLPGDHFSVISPRSRGDRGYKSLTAELLREEVALAANPEALVAGPPTRDRILFVLLGSHPDEPKCNRVLAKEADEGWRLNGVLPYMLPSMAAKDDVADMRHAASKQLGIPVDGFSLSIQSKWFKTANRKPSAGDKSATYSFRLVTLVVERPLDAVQEFKLVGNRRACWATVKELRGHESTMKTNGDVIDQLAQVYGAFLNELDIPILELNGDVGLLEGRE